MNKVERKQAAPTVEQIIEVRGSLSQREAAHLIGVTPRTWSNYENGHTSMRPRDFEYLSEHIRKYIRYTM